MNAPDYGADVGHAAGAAEGHDAPGQTRLRQLADEQAALRRLAMLVARGEPPEAVFAAATGEALRYFGGGTARMIRYEPDGTATLLANEGTTGPHVRVGQRWEGYPPTGLTAAVRRTGQAARVDDYRDIPGGEPYLREGCGPRSPCRSTSTAGCGESSPSGLGRGRCRPIPSSG